MDIISNGEMAKAGLDKEIAQKWLLCSGLKAQRFYNIKKPTEYRKCKHLPTCRSRKTMAC